MSLAEKFEDHFEANGSGAFGRIEQNEKGIVLRTAVLKTPDRGSNVTVYFDSNREQVMTGRRFDVMGDLWLMRQGVSYRIYTNVVLSKELPAGVSVRVELTEDAKDALGIMSSTIEVGSEISFTVLSLRNMEVEHDISLVNLIFEGSEVGVSEVKVTSKRGPKKGNSTRTRKLEEVDENESNIPEGTSEEGDSEG